MQKSKNAYYLEYSNNLWAVAGVVLTHAHPAKREYSKPNARTCERGGEGFSLNQ